MSDNTYINIGKYLVHRNNLLGGKLQVRSPNKNQVYGFKSQNITNNIKDILLKLNKKEPISFKDVDKLNEEDRKRYKDYRRIKCAKMNSIASSINQFQLKGNFEEAKDKINTMIENDDVPLTPEIYSKPIKSKIGIQNLIKQIIDDID